MRGIISRPEGPLTGFAKGAGATFIAVGIPIMVGTLFMHGQGVSLWAKLEVSGAITAVMCMVAGCGLAIWRLIQGWAYSQISDDPT